MNVTELDFDFDTMAQLARDDPDGFARYREQLICRFIERSSHSDRLADLQLDIDAIRYGLPPGMRTAEKMISMMMDSTERMMDRFERLYDFVISARPDMRQ